MDAGSMAWDHTEVHCQRDLGFWVGSSSEGGSSRVAAGLVFPHPLSLPPPGRQLQESGVLQMPHQGPQVVVGWMLAGVQLPLLVAGLSMRHKRLDHIPRSLDSNLLRHATVSVIQGRVGTRPQPQGAVIPDLNIQDRQSARIPAHC